MIAFALPGVVMATAPLLAPALGRSRGSPDSRPATGTVRCVIHRDCLDLHLVVELELVTGDAPDAPVGAGGLGDGDLDVGGAEPDR